MQAAILAPGSFFSPASPFLPLLPFLSVSRIQESLGASGPANDAVERRGRGSASTF